MIRIREYFVREKIAEARKWAILFRGNWPPGSKTAGVWRADVLGGWSLGRFTI